MLVTDLKIKVLLHGVNYNEVVFEGKFHDRTPVQSRFRSLGPTPKTWKDLFPSEDELPVKEWGALYNMQVVLMKEIIR